MAWATNNYDIFIPIAPIRWSHIYFRTRSKLFCASQKYFVLSKLMRFNNVADKAPHPCSFLRTIKHTNPHYLKRCIIKYSVYI